MGTPLFHKLLADAVPLTHLGDIQRAKVLHYFATDSCERLLRLEQRLRSNEDAECFQMLADIRRHIAAGTRAGPVPERAHAALAQASGSPRL